MLITPRDYQTEAVNSIYRYFETHPIGNPLIAMPTGTGKSVVIAAFLESVYRQYRGQRIMMLTHVKELIEQNFDKLVKLWPNAPAGIYSAGLNRRDVYNSITFGGIGSVNKKSELFGHVDLLIIDEAHLLSPNQNTMYRKFISDLVEINPLLRMIGLTATPFRMGQGYLTEGDNALFTDICFDITGMEAFNRLIAEYYLCPLIPKRTKTILEVDGVHMRGGEFIPKELQKAVDRDELTIDALREAMEYTDRKKWLIFTSGVEHTIHTAELAQSLGISCKPLHSNTKDYKMSDKERDETLDMFKRGEIMAIANNNILTTGFDDPEIDLIVCLRPTGSVGLWIQMLGRGTRPLYAPGYDLSTIEGRKAACEAGGKENCLVLDYGGNTLRLGPINDPIVPNPKGKKGGTPPVKICEECDTYNHASVRLCVCCGNEFVFETKLLNQSSTEELIKGDLPEIIDIEVEHITYSRHRKKHRPDSVKVSYYCGLQMFTEYVCIEHPEPTRSRAQSWWEERSGVMMPESTEMALRIVDQLITPSHLRVWVNKKYPEIMAYCFDGSNFGKQETNEMRPRIQIDAKELKLAKYKEDDKIPLPGEGEPYTGDDIPF